MSLEFYGGQPVNQNAFARDEMAELALTIAESRVAIESFDSEHCDDTRYQELHNIHDAAVKKFTVGNLGIVHSIARSYMARPRTSMEYDDLMQAGVIGLMGAVHAFDPQRGFTFVTFARDRIKQAISRGIDNTDRIIRIPAEQAERMRADFNRDGEYATAEDAVHQARSKVLSAEAVENQEGRPVEIKHEDGGFSQVENSLDLDALMREAGLTQQEYDLLVASYGLKGAAEMRNTEIAKALGTSVSSIERLRKNALQKIREHIEMLGIERSTLY